MNLCVDSSFVLPYDTKRRGEKMDCESCNNYVYDEEYDEYLCEAYFDEDELAQLMQNSRAVCPHWCTGDDYKVVRRQGL